VSEVELPSVIDAGAAPLSIGPGSLSRLKQLVRDPVYMTCTSADAVMEAEANPEAPRSEDSAQEARPRRNRRKVRSTASAAGPGDMRPIQIGYRMCMRNGFGKPRRAAVAIGHDKPGRGEIPGLHRLRWSSGPMTRPSREAFGEL